MNTVHESVMIKEVIESLNLTEGCVVVDATLGGGGYSSVIAKKISPGGKLTNGFLCDFLRNVHRRILTFNRS